MKNEISINIPEISEPLYSAYELELGDIVSTEPPEIAKLNDIRLVTSEGLFSLETGGHGSPKDSKVKFYYKFPADTIINLTIK